MDKGLTKDHSKMLQGLAILMMLYHHLFSTPEALGIDYISLLSFGGINVELHMAWFFKLCVAIYAFVSGYGLCRSMPLILDAPNEKFKTDEGFFRLLIKDYHECLKHLFWFYTQYWLVFVLFVPIGFLFYNRQFVFSEFILNFVGLSSSYNGAWWYVLFYLRLILIMPLCDCFFRTFNAKKDKCYKALFYLVIAAFLLAFKILDAKGFSNFVDSLQMAFLLCFLVGFIVSRFSLYELAIRLLTARLAYALGILGFVLVICARVKIAKDASSAGLDFIFVPVFAFGFIVIMTLCPYLGRIFKFIGKYSTFMWLTHVFFYDHYSKNLVMFTRFSTGIYLTLLVLSFATAYVLDVLYRLLKRGLKRVCHL